MSNERYALVTGTSSGLGLEMASQLLDSGWTVFGASRSDSPIEHENFIDIETDIRDEQSVVALFDRIEEETESLHLIVNNAGIYSESPLSEMSSEDFQDQLATNVLGPFHILKYAHAMVEEGETHVITISTNSAKKGAKNLAAYSASKSALERLTESVKEEWSALGVRFTTLSPGMLDTPLWDEVDDIERDNMLDPDDFLRVFEMVVKSPAHVNFSEITFDHKSGE
jgi:NAD(P)-dependent dehydrogenase (short-subunit alcohol dehydrogenase family)